MGVCQLKTIGEKMVRIVKLVVIIADSSPTSLPTIDVTFTHANLSLPPRVCCMKAALESYTL